MVFKKTALIIVSIAIFLSLISIISGALATANVVNTPPKLTITSMNLNPGTSRDIYSFILDPNGDTVSCSYCLEGMCYQTCRIYSPKIPGIYRFNITLNDSINVSKQQITVFVPGEVPQKSDSSSSSDIPSLPEKNPQSPYENTETIETETNNQTEKSKEDNLEKQNQVENTEYCIVENIKDKPITGKDIIFSIIILSLLGAIFALLERDHKKRTSQRREKIKTLGEIFTEEEDD